MAGFCIPCLCDTVKTRCYQPVVELYFYDEPISAPFFSIVGFSLVYLNYVMLCKKILYPPGNIITVNASF